MLFYRNSQWSLRTTQELSCMGGWDDLSRIVICMLLKIRKITLVLIPLLCCLKVDWGQGAGADPWTCWQSYIFPREESTTSAERRVYIVMGQNRAWLESSWERLSGVLLWECWLGLSLTHNYCQLSGFQHRGVFDPTYAVCTAVIGLK